MMASKAPSQVVSKGQIRELWDIPLARGVVRARTLELGVSCALGLLLS